MRRLLERRTLAAAVAVCLAAASLAGSFSARADAGHKGAHKPITTRLKLPKMDSKKGMYLFASKGCVTCHAINGVGGHNSARLDAHAMKPVMSPFELIAKMWRAAPAMIAAQEEAFGEQITFTGAQIAHIIAFLHDDAQQHKFTEAMIPPKIKKAMKHSHGGAPAHKKSGGHRMGQGRGMGGMMQRK
ncbi:MAG: c-type cytochrome [Alphaproteobacteria bacterium]